MTGNTEIAELMMLRQAAELYTCAKILRYTIEGDEHAKLRELGVEVYG